MGKKARGTGNQNTGTIAILMTSLGWLNDKLEEERIREWVKRCDAQGHSRQERTGGSSPYSGWRVISCETCQFLYQVDSGD